MILLAGLAVMAGVDVACSGAASSSRTTAPPGRHARVALLFNSKSQDAPSANSPLMTGLRERGWVVGQNLTIDLRFTGGDAEQLETLAKDLLAHKPDVIVSVVPPTTHVLRKLTTTVPIVMVAEPAPLETGLVSSLARPGGNVTGVTFDPTQEVFAKYLELLHEAVPRANRVAVVGELTLPGAKGYRRFLNDAARSLKVSLDYEDIRIAADVERALASVRARKPGAFLVLPGAVTWDERQRLAEFSVAQRLPSMFGFVESVEAGGLLAYAASLPDMFRRAAVQIDKVLRGTPPGEIAVELPSRFELTVNLATARRIGLTLPQTLLFRAERVIE